MTDTGPWITKTIIELEERNAELETMVLVFRAALKRKSSRPEPAGVTDWCMILWVYTSHGRTTNETPHTSRTHL